MRKRPQKLDVFFSTFNSFTARTILQYFASQLFRKLSKTSVSRLSNEISSNVNSGRGLILSTSVKERKNKIQSKIAMEISNVWVIGRSKQIDFHSAFIFGTIKNVSRKSSRLRLCRFLILSTEKAIRIIFTYLVFCLVFCNRLSHFERHLGTLLGVPFELPPVSSRSHERC